MCYLPCHKGARLTTDDDIKAYVESVIANLPPLDDERLERLTAIFANT